MSIPLGILLIIYLVFVLFWLLFSFFNIFHAAKFGLATTANIVTLTVYVILSLAVLAGSLIFIAAVDWSQQITLFSF